jgi:CTP synthase
VGKYTHLEDAYLSVIEAIKAAAVWNGAKAEIVWVDSEKIDPSTSSGQGYEEAWALLKSVHGIVVPGGFGKRGIEGKIKAAQYARTSNIPYLGLCLGSQIMAIEFARDALKDPQLTSEEFDEEDALSPDKYVVHFLPGQHKGKEKGGTLRLGSYDCQLHPGTKAREIYGTDVISERHRHRYEFNNDFRKDLEAKGLLFSGENPESGLMEIVEVKDHPFMVGSQFHPEFKSRPHKPHPLFREFMKAVVANN